MRRDQSERYCLAGQPVTSNRRQHAYPNQRKRNQNDGKAAQPRFVFCCYKGKPWVSMLHKWVLLEVAILYYIMSVCKK